MNFKKGGGVAGQPSPVQGGISNDIATQGTHEHNGMMQVAEAGELTDTKEVEEQDRGLMLRQLFGDDMDHLAAEHWQDLGQTVVSRRWQYEIVAAAVALLTGGGDCGGDAECRPTAEEEEEMDMWSPWVGSNMDRAKIREGHIRLMALNPRVMAQAVEGRQAQQQIWKRAASLHAEVVLLPDDGLVDPTLKHPKSTLVKAKALAAEAWGQRGLVWTHDQGQPGVSRKAVGGASLVVSDAVASIQAQQVTDMRGWGRYTGRVLEGTDHRRLIVITVYFPCETLGEGSAWQTQLRGMQLIASDERKANPLLQAVHDLLLTISRMMTATKSQQTKDDTQFIIMGDFNTRFEVKPGARSTDKKATEALQSMARQLGLAEAMHWLHPGCEPSTYRQSEKQGANKSWIDYALITKELLAQGLVTEAGVLQHEQLAGSDHRAYVIEVDLDSVLHLGQQWKQKPSKQKRMPRLPLQKQDTVALFQRTLVNKWSRGRVSQAQKEAEHAVEQWSRGRDQQADWECTSDWGEVDTRVLEPLETFHDAAIKAFTAAWRSAADRLPSCTGNSRKDCWSKVYGKQADEYRVLVAVSSMWRTQGRKQDMLAKLKAVPSVLDRLKWAPTLQDPHRTWKRWLICVALAARELRKLMHGSWRQHNQAEMKGAIKHRSDEYAAGRQGKPIASWTNKPKKAAPMRSTIVERPDGSKVAVVDPIKVRHTADNKFERWFNDRYGPSTWYEGHVLTARTQAGWAARRRMAQDTLTEQDREGVPERLHYVVRAMQCKHIKSLGCKAHPGLYQEAGLMQEVSPETWRQFWARTKKGIAPGPSELTVDMIWAAQMVLPESVHKQRHQPGKRGTVKQAKLRQADAEEESVCVTAHCFDGLRVLVCMVLATGIVPGGMLRELLCPIDKVEGLVDLANKRPLGLVEMLMQALLGIQVRIVTGVWDDNSMIDDFQVGCTKALGCEAAIMNLMAKLEYSYLHKTPLVLPLNDQSKAFDTLGVELGMEAPMRRLGLPEKYLKLRSNCKNGSWCMTVTAHGPNPKDWNCIKSCTVDGANAIRPAGTAVTTAETSGAAQTVAGQAATVAAGSSGTARPASQPCAQPGSQPYAQPNVQPSAHPSIQPSSQPCAQPGSQPSAQPCAQPSVQPSAQLCAQPSMQPPAQPSAQPSTQPCAQPGSRPSAQPSSQPCAQPGSQPSAQPCAQPSVQPSAQLWAQPSVQPPAQPSTQPSSQPCAQPGSQPSAQPSSQPCAQPGSQPVCAAELTAMCTAGLTAICTAVYTAKLTAMCTAGFTATCTAKLTAMCTARLTAICTAVLPTARTGNGAGRINGHRAHAHQSHL